MCGDRKQYDVSRPSSGMKPRGFKPKKKADEESPGNQITGETEPKDSE